MIMIVSLNLSQEQIKHTDDLRNI